MNTYVPARTRALTSVARASVLSCLLVAIACDPGAEGSEAAATDESDGGAGENNSDLGEKAASVTYEAESSTAKSGCAVASNHAGYKGAGFVDFVNNGAWLEWSNVNAAAAGDYSLSLRYANASESNRPGDVLVNGTKVGTLAFASTSSWTNWGTTSIKAKLRSGSNTIRIATSPSVGGPNIDNMSVTSLGGGDPGTLPPLYPCTNPSTRPVDQDRWSSKDSKFGDATFVFYDFDKSSRQHVVPLENTLYSHTYIIEVGSQSRDPSYTHISRRTTSSNVKPLAGGGSSDKYQFLNEVTGGSSATFNQPGGSSKCIRDEGQYIVIYTNKSLRLIAATMRDPELTGHNNQYSGAPNDSSFSLIADDETSNPNRTREGGATTRMMASANFYTFEDKDNGFFLYKSGSKVPTFTGNGCDAQYQFY